MNIRLHIVVPSIAAFFLILSQSTVWARPVTCAVLFGGDVRSTAAALPDLVEQELAKLDNVVLLERAAIHMILDEHRLMLARENADRHHWKEWGQVLRANLIIRILVRQVDTVEVVQVEFAETNLGIVVARESFVWSEDPAPIVQVIGARIDNAILLAGDGIRQIIAVPPFESGDLTYKHAHLKRSLATLIETCMSRIPGVVVVDFQYAHETAKELAISRGSNTVVRSLPIYVHGRYRTSGVGDSVTLSVQMELREGERTIADQSRDDLNSLDVAGFVIKSAERFGEHVQELVGTRKKKVAGEAGLEARLLACRVDAFGIVGDWVDAAAVGEACLLLDPDNLGVRRWVAEAYGYLGRDHPFGQPAQAKQLDQEVTPASASRLARRQMGLMGVEHWRRYFSNADITVSDVRAYGAFVSKLSIWTTFSNVMDDESLAAHRALMQYEREVLQLIISRVDLDCAKEVVWYASLKVASMIGNADGRPLTEYYGTVRDTVLVFDRFPFAVYEQFRILMDVLPTSAAMTNVRDRNAEMREAFFRCLEEIQQQSDSGGGIAARIVQLITLVDEHDDKEQILAEVQRSLSHCAVDRQDRPDMLSRVKRHLGLVERPPGIVSMQHPFDVGGVRFTPLNLFRSEQPDTLLHPTEIWHMSECSDEVDVIVNSMTVYLVDSNKFAHRLDVDRGAGSAWILSADCDGRYVWVLRRGEDRHVQVFDLHTRKSVAAFGADDGLPPISKTGLIATMSPTEAVAVGEFGRTWIAQLRLEETSPGEYDRTVDVLLEARDLPEGPRESPRIPQIALDASSAFTPEQLAVVPASSTGGPWAVVWRGHSDRFHWSLTPVIVDLRAKTYEITDTPWGHASSIVLCGDRLVALRHHGRFGDPIGFAFLFPETRTIERHVIAEMAPAYRVGYWPGACDKGQLHMVSDYWCSVDLASHELVRMEMLPTEFHNLRVFASPLFGLVCYGNSFGEVSLRGTWQVTFQE